MSKCNCPNCGAPYVTLSVKCDYCGTQKDFEGLDVSYSVLYANDKPMCVSTYVEPYVVTQPVCTWWHGKYVDWSKT